MRLPPKNTVAKDAIAAWKITVAIYMALVWIIVIAGVIVSNLLDFPTLYAFVAVATAALVTYVCIFQFPRMRWRRWRYQVFDQEIYIQHGILIMSRTLVPMIRVQHVDTKQGPILKKYQLASVTISTAATTHEIPALSEADASDIRDRISALARVDDADV